jgi:ABC-type nitrate/sulfonate/bicarbonate transport system ATPase subunit
LWKKQKTTTLFVTHNLREAAHIGKYIVLLPGQTAGSPEIVENPLFQPGAERLAANEFQVEQIIGQRMKEIQKDRSYG